MRDNQGLGGEGAYGLAYRTPCPHEAGYAVACHCFDPDPFIAPRRMIQWEDKTTPLYPGERESPFR